MRRRKSIIAVVLISLMTVFLLSGCIRAEVDINIRNTGKGDIKVLLATQESLSSLSDSEGTLMSEEDLQKLRDEGWTVEEYASGGYTGNLISKQNVSLSELSFPVGDSGSFSDNAKITKKGSVYTIDLTLFEEDEIKTMEESLPLLKTAGGSFLVRMTLPTPALESNATSVTNEGKTLEWDFTSMDLHEPLHVSFKMPLSILPVIALIAAVIFAAFVVICIIRDRKKMKEGKMPKKDAYFEKPAERTCRVCGEVMRPGDIFCPKCGTKVDSGLP